MPEELDLAPWEEEILDKISKELDEIWEEDLDSAESNTALSYDVHGREHRDKGPGGGQFLPIIPKSGTNRNIISRTAIGISRPISRLISKLRKRLWGEPKDKDLHKDITKNISKDPPKLPKTRPESNEVVSLEEQKKAIDKALRKFKQCPIPTEEEVESNLIGLAERGGTDYRRQIIGNTTDRRRRRNRLLKEFGDGTHCPCIYCGKKLTHGTLEQNKMYTTEQGGRYRLSNIIPSCNSCNKQRGVMKFETALKRIVKYVE